MWIRIFKIVGNYTIKTKYFTNYNDAYDWAHAFVRANPDCDWEGM